MTLSETVTALLSPHKSKGKWSDPSASVGDKVPFVGLRRKYTCWKAVGPAQKLFNDELGPSIRAFLHGCAPSNHEVYITFCMVGKTKETAAPKVIFSCPDETVRKNLRKYIEESSIMASDRFTGIQLGDSSVRPGIPIRWTAHPGAAEGEGDYGSQDTSEAPGPRVFSTKPRIGLGDLLLVRNQPGNSATFTRGTSGPILYWQEKEFCLTVDHLFNRHYASVVDPREPTCSIHGLSDSDSESDIDSEQERLREASITSEECGESPWSWPSLDWERDTSSTSNSQSASDNQVQSDAPHKQHCKGVEDEGLPEASGERTLIQAIGAVQLNSVGSSLDYALVEVTGKTVRYPNVLCTSKFISSCLSISDFAEIPRHPVNICTVTASSGPLTGVLRPDVTYVRRPNSAAFGAMHEVELHGILANGDSGSAVVDSNNGCLYGLIVAGTLGTGAAFVIPAEEVVQDIERQHGITLSLSSPPKPVAPRALDVRHQQKTASFVQSPTAALTVGGSSVRSSVRSKVPSVFSQRSVASTALTQHSHIDLPPTRQNLTDLIANDLASEPLLTAALSENAGDIKTFTTTLYLLLDFYGKELEEEAKSPQHSMTASFVRSQARLIARVIIKRYRLTEDAGRSPLHKGMSEYAATDRLDNIMPTLQSFNAREHEAAVQGNLTSFSELKGFLTSGRPLENLRNRLKDFVRVPIGHSGASTEAITELPAVSGDKWEPWRVSRIASDTDPNEYDFANVWANYGEQGLAGTLRASQINQASPGFKIDDLDDPLSFEIPPFFLSSTVAAGHEATFLPGYAAPQLHNGAALVGSGLAYPTESSGGPSGFSSSTIPQLDRKSPRSEILVPETENHGRYSTMRTPAEGEMPNENYQVQKNPRDFFTVGRVFSIFWHKPAGALATTPDPKIIRGLGELFYNSVRCMVVIRGFHGYAWCCPITTHYGRGTYIIVPRGGQPPTPNLRGTMQKEPLYIDLTTGTEDFPPVTWLGFRDIVTVSHDMKVRPVGMISEESMLEFDFSVRTRSLIELPTKADYS